MTREEVSPDGRCRRHRELNKKLLPSSTDPNKEASNEDPPVAQNASRLVKAVFASQIDYIELRHMNGRVADSLFRLSPQELFFKTKLPSPTGEREIGMKALQLPVIVNNATTAHKLQGSTVDSIFVHQWSTKRNWNHVVLSRVREMKGFFARKPLPSKLELHKVPKKLDNMLHVL